MALITCKNLDLGYDNNIVVKDLSFEVHYGDYLAIVGENGSGKTTLMKTLLGLIKPISGKIYTGEGLKRNEIGYLPQHSDFQQDFPASVWEVVLSGRLSKTGLKPFYSRADKAMAQKNIERMGLAGLEKRSFKELSGGQQQRVLLARALCATRKVLLLDEPISGLDQKVSGSMYSIIEDLNKDQTTIIMISHDVHDMLKYATHILHLGEENIYCTKEEYIEYLHNNGEDEMEGHIHG